MNPLGIPAGFEDPLAVLATCHVAIESQLAKLLRLCRRVSLHGLDADARSMAGELVIFFANDVQQHHADEEIDLFPKVLRAAEASEDRAHAFELVSHLLVEHREMDSAWEQLQASLQARMADETAPFDAEHCRDFSRRYASHIKREEAELLPLARRLLTESDLQALGAALTKRRGLDR